MNHTLSSILTAVLFSTSIVAQDAPADTTIELSNVTVSAKRSGTTMSMRSQLKTETITSTGLKKMACCSLAESFENSASASISYADAVSGARSIQLLGLAGQYTQVMNENMPSMHGLASAYGWNYIPSTWLESIQISKGASSVVGGYESIAGQINMGFRKPNIHEPLYADVYLNDMLHLEANVAAKTEINDHLWSNLLLHTTKSFSPDNNADLHDRNNDTFLDTPDDDNIFLSNRWLYIGQSGLQMRTGFTLIYDDLNGGQHSSHNTPLYTTDIRNVHLNIYNKTGLSVGDNGSIGIINTYTRSYLNADLGAKNYNGDEDFYWGSAIYNNSSSSDTHRFTTGLNWSTDRYRAHFADSLQYNLTPSTRLSYREITIGAICEYTLTPNESLTLMAGIRADYNNRYNWLITPRANIRFAPFKWLVLRASAGHGYRSSQPLTESMRLMASSRQFDLSGINDLNIENAWNMGGNIAFNIPIWQGRNASLSIDYFHTIFNEQTIIDSERDADEVHFYNLDNAKSSADVFQADLSLSIIERLDLFTAIRVNTNHLSYHDIEGNTFRKERPLTSTLRGLINVEYATRMRKWVFDFTYQLNGKERLPGDGYSVPDTYSPIYPVLFAQTTKNGRRFDIYAGIENILDYKQDNPINNWQSPFSKSFDASNIWGPVEGRKIYFGCRLRLGEL